MIITRLELDDFDKLCKLLSRYKAEIHEDMPSDADFENLKNAMRRKCITFFGAKAEGKLVGCCSLVKCYSTFCFSDMAVFEDFHILPERRHTGIANRLVDFAVKSEPLGSVIVGASKCDEEMYRALGFTERLGSMLALIP